MLNLPFLFPESDINLRLARLLILIDKLSRTKRGKLVLNLGKIAIFDFLVRYPQVLYYTLDNNFSFTVREYEIGNIDSQYPEVALVFNYKETDIVLKVLLAYGFIEVIKNQKDIYYIITESGQKIVEELDSDYFFRVREIVEAIRPLQKENESELRMSIKHNIKGV
ncbi:ABC-three component system middle component 4 [Pelosinus sp. sgz500959]|uniref:ABC-three component system middle component 4 n=1 Tax=Pelosinus sp. sgz500959 TaxID=3242472 RepID=UPI00366DD684